MQIPGATYRLQLHQGLGFAARARAGRLPPASSASRDCYTSPLLAADARQHPRLRRRRPREARLRSSGPRPSWSRSRPSCASATWASSSTSSRTTCAIASSRNTWWSDVLENGPSSPYARYFDIDWHPPKADLKAKVLLPILGDQFGRVLEDGEIARPLRGRDVRRARTTRPGCRSRRAPGRTCSSRCSTTLRASRGELEPSVLELESILTALEHLPLRTDTERARVRERRREKEIVKRRLATLLDVQSRRARRARRAVDAINGTRGDPAASIVSRRCSPIRATGPASGGSPRDEINYRRFFDINELAAIRDRGARGVARGPRDRAAAS